MDQWGLGRSKVYKEILTWAINHNVNKVALAPWNNGVTNMKNIIIILLTLTSILFSGLIKGHIKDNEENLLGEANITIEETTLGSASDDKGYYLITGIKEGSYSMKCSYIGYHTITAVGVTVCDDSLTVVDFTLYPLEMEMEALEIEHDTETVKDLQF